VKTIKPLRMGVLVRPYELAGRVHGVVTGYVPFRLDDPQHLLTDMEMWLAIAGVLGEGGIFDEGLAKISGEVLAGGHVYPRNPPQAVSYARITLSRGDRGPFFDKRVAAFGDRRWRAGISTDPQPFSKMPLVWERAYGGEGYARNPKGRGAVATASEAGSVHALPNLEDPERLVRAPSDAPRPSCFLPFDPTWPQRLSKHGKNYDAAWLRERSPGPADDLDPTYYHQGDDDQRLGAYLEGGERYVLENLHPEHGRIEGELPRLDARAFISRRPAGIAMPRRGKALVPGPLEEVGLRPETIWFLPDALLGVLVYRGATIARDDDLADLEHLVLGLDDPRSRRPLAHFERVMADRLDPEVGAILSIDEQALLPPAELGWKVSFPSFEIDDKIRPEGHLRANLQRRKEAERERARATLVEQELDPADYGLAGSDAVEEAPPPITEPQKLADYVRRQLERSDRERATLEQKKRDAEARAAELTREAIALAKEHGIELPPIDMIGKRDLGPPKLELRLRLERMFEGVTIPETASFDLEALRRGALDEATLAKLEQQQGRLLEAYRRNAHMLPEGRPLEGALADTRREQARLAKEIGEGLAGVDLSGADLSGLDLSGLDLTGAFLEGATLAGARLAGCKLDDAVLARCKLDDAVLDGASLRRANLGAARLHRTSMRGVDATDAVFMRAELVETVLRGARLEGVQLLEASVRGADLGETTGNGVLFAKLDLSGCSFERSKLTKAVFFESILDGASFELAELPYLQLVDTKATKLHARGLRAHHAFIGWGSSLDHANLDEADLTRASLRTTSMKEVSLRVATLVGSDLSECDLSLAVLEGAQARGAMLLRTSLHGAKLRGANLMEALLTKADLAECDLRGANLFRADLSRVHLSGGTQIDGALLELARVDPKETKEQEA
jgi:uncharacterized protein YjbI with pentapeptide repeats